MYNIECYHARIVFYYMVSYVDNITKNVAIK